jgi:hypothetical protein
MCKWEDSLDGIELDLLGSPMRPFLTEYKVREEEDLRELVWNKTNNLDDLRPSQQPKDRCALNLGESSSFLNISQHFFYFLVAFRF